MGHLADGFADFRISAVHRHAIEYLLGDFLRVLNEKDCADLLKFYAHVATTSGAIGRKQDYEAFRLRLVMGSYDVSVVGNLLGQAILCDIYGGSELLREFLKRLDPILSKPEYCASLISKRLFHQVQTQQFVDEAEDLLREARQAVAGGAEDEEDERLAPIAIDSLQGYLGKTLPLYWQLYDHMLERSEIQQRHSFVAAGPRCVLMPMRCDSLSSRPKYLSQNRRNTRNFCSRSSRGRWSN